MPYTKTTWVDRVLDGSGNPIVAGTPLSAANLNNIETGIDNATNGLVTFPNGSATAPSITFANSTTTGLYRATTNVIGIATAGAEAMRIDASGNVGISATPSDKLHVKGATRVEATSAPANNYGRINHNSSATLDYGLTLSHFNGGTKDVEITLGGNSGTSLNNVITFNTNSIEAMRINGSQYVLVGYTASNGTYKLQVNSQIFATSSTVATSDARYKENIEAIDGALDIVKKLNPVSFNWKPHQVHNFDTQTKTIGFLAQEVKEVLKDKTYLNSIIKSNECTITDEEGNETKEEFLGIAEGNLIAILTKAIQELSLKIDKLEGKIK